MTAKALRSTRAPTASIAPQRALGTVRAASWVSSAVATHASRPMKAQPATANTAISAAREEPPKKVWTVPMSSKRTANPWRLKNSSSTSPTNTDATASAAMPNATMRREHVDAAGVDQRGDNDERRRGRD